MDVSNWNIKYEVRKKADNWMNRYNVWKKKFSIIDLTDFRNSFMNFLNLSF